jgi:hypothetical protein
VPAFPAYAPPKRFYPTPAGHVNKYNYGRPFFFRLRQKFLKKQLTKASRFVNMVERPFERGAGKNLKRARRRLKRALTTKNGRGCAGKKFQ